MRLALWLETWAARAVVAAALIPVVVGAAHADDGPGTSMAWDAGNFGGGVSLPGVKSRGPWHGQWERTGPRQIIGTWQAFAFAADGTHVLTAVLTAVFDFDADFRTATGPFIVKYFHANQNPLWTPHPEPLTVGEGTTLSVSRINVDRRALE